MSLIDLLNEDLTQLLDYDSFVDSLTIEQAGCLAMTLSKTKHSSLHPLKVALERRLRETPLRGIRKAVERRFYRGRNREHE